MHRQPLHLTSTHASVIFTACECARVRVLCAVLNCASEEHIWPVLPRSVYTLRLLANIIILTISNL
jgi:hypothetical protein